MIRIESMSTDMFARCLAEMRLPDPIEIEDPEGKWVKFEDIRDRATRAISIDDDRTPQARASKDRLIIDFTRNPGLLAKIKEIAQDEEREPERQVLYWLKTFRLLMEMDEEE